MSKTNTNTSKKVYRDVRKQTPPQANVGFFKRFFAYLLDFYLGMLLCSLPIVLANGILNQSDKMQMNLFYFDGVTFYIVAAVSLLLGFWYYVYIPCSVWKGQTLAKHLFHFKIVKMDGEDVDLKSLFLRQIIGMFIIEGSVVAASSLLRQIMTYATSMNFIDPLIYVGFAITILSAIMMIFGKNRRMLHDIIGTTMVVLSA